MIAEIEQAHLAESGFTERYKDSSGLFRNVDPGACHRAYRGPDLQVYPQTTLWIA